jgi:hypothetical protein
MQVFKLESIGKIHMKVTLMMKKMFQIFNHGLVVLIGGMVK